MLSQYAEVGYLPPWGIGWTLGLGAVAAGVTLAFALCHRAARSSWKGTFLLLLLRLLAIVVLVWMLLGPTRALDGIPESVAQRVVVLVDESLSMGQEDVPATEGKAISRRAAARAWIQRAPLPDDADLLAFDDHVRPWASDVVAGRATHLIDALNEAASTGAVAPPETGGVLVVLSDGHDTRQANPAEAALDLQRRNWRVVALPLGAEAAGPDLAVTAWPRSHRVLQGQSTWLDVQLTHHGLSGQTVALEVRHAGRPIEFREVLLDSEAGEAGQRVSFRLTPPGPAAGESLDATHSVGYEVRAVPLREERVVTNNAAWAFVQVVRTELRVLLLEGEPYWETRFLARALSDDPLIALTAVYALGTERKWVVQASETVSVDAASLEQGEGLDAFDAIVLGRRCERLLSPRGVKALRDYVIRRGGALIFARGEPFHAGVAEGQAALATLADVSPVDWGQRVTGRMQLSLTEAGARSPILGMEALGESGAVLTRLPAMTAATRIDGMRAASLVLLEHAPLTPPRSRPAVEAPEHVALVYQQVGAGRVLALLTEGMWRWAMGAAGPAEREHDDTRPDGPETYFRFWSRTLRWLALGDAFLPGHHLSMTLDRTQVEPAGSAGADDTVTVRVVGRDVGDPDQVDLDLHIVPQSTSLQVTSADQPRSQPWSAPLAPLRSGAPIWTARLSFPEQGVYRVELHGPGLATPLESHVVVQATSPDQVDPSARPEVLATLARLTGGTVLDRERPEMLAEYLRDVHAAEHATPGWAYAYDRPLALTLVMLALGAEWFIRRTLGRP